MKREIIPANEDIFNQSAKGALKKAGRSPDPRKLYCLQLVRWAVEIGEIKGLNEHLLLFLELLEGWKPASVMNFLEKKDGALLSITGEKDFDPRDLAHRMINYLDSCMAEKVEGYPLRKKLAAGTVRVSHP